MSRPFIWSGSGSPIRRVSTLLLFYTASPLLLIAATWQLWIPHHDRFPQTPFFASLTTCPPVVDWCCIVAAVLGLVVVVAALARMRTSMLRLAATVFLVAFTLLVLLDQQRFQPWAYHLILVWVVLLSADWSNERSTQRAVRLLQILLIGIYFHSAVSKFDTAFADQHGRRILAGFCDAIGLPADDWLDRNDPRWLDRRRVLLAMPLVELIGAAGLCWKRTRKIAVGLILIVHAFLLVALGPLGLNHEIGVLAWNIMFMIQGVLLFWPHKNAADGWDENATDAQAIATRSRIIPKFVAILIVGAGCILPFGRPTYWDMWPSWSLYSPRNVELVITIDEAELNRVTGNCRRYLSAPDFHGNCHVRVDQWALGELAAPMYPSPRIECAAARWLQSRWQLNSVRLSIKGEPRTKMSVSQIPTGFNFQLNAQPNLYVP